MTSELPERFDLATEPPGVSRLALLKELFPEAAREDSIDIDALRRAMGDWVDPGPERFGLTWPGKAECMRVIQEPSIGTLVPVPEDSIDWELTQNVTIEGDNLEVLKLLQKAYYSQIKLIYIDPPYNTGGEFIYPDNFREGLDDYLRYSGQVDEAGLRMSANAETDGRYHSKWLSMMYPRLFLARNLLRDDGVIFVSIDDHESNHLRSLMSEIFGEENFVTTFVWEKRTTRENRRAFSISHDYIVCFARNKEAFELTRGLLPLSDEAAGRYSNPDNDPRGEWQSVSLNAQAGHATKQQFYVITTPGGRVLEPPPGRCWSVTQERLQELISDNRVWFGSDGMNVPRLKHFRSESREGLTPHTLWRSGEVGTNDSATKYLNELLGDDAVFDTPKPLELLKRVVTIGAPFDGDLVLDFFAGSGTTGEAVLAADGDDGVRRRYILVQLPEPVEGRSGLTLSELMRRRLRAASDRRRDTLQLGDAPDLGFRTYRLERSCFTVWQSKNASVEALQHQLSLSVDHIVDGATAEAMLTELLLKAGFSLTAPIEPVGFSGVEGYSVAEGALLICLSEALTIEAFEAMVAIEPAMILVLDTGFGGSDELKVNALQTVRSRNQQSGSDIALRVV